MKNVQNIAIIGGGNLGSSLARGLVVNSQRYSIVLTRRNVEKIAHFETLGIRTSQDNISAAKSADIILLALKPFQVIPVLRQIKDVIDDKVIISLATGVTIADMKNVISNRNNLILRAMPNTAMRQGMSMTCVSRSPLLDPGIQADIHELFQSIGKVIWIEENLFDAATVLGACGIAYAMRFMRAMMQGGIQIGFDAETSLSIVTQTIMGAGTILQNENTHPESEIDKVTTPKGCTIAGLNEMEHQGFSSALIKGIKVSYDEISFIKNQALVGKKDE